MTTGLYNEHLLAEINTATKTKRVPWGAGGDSLTFSDTDSGTMQGLEKAHHTDGEGLYAYEMGSPRGGGSYGSERNGHSLNDASLDANSTDEHGDYRMASSDMVGGSGSHVFFNDAKSIAASAGRKHVASYDHPNLLNSIREAVTVQIFHLGFASGTGSEFRPQFEGASGASTRSSGNVPTVDSVTGTDGEFLVAEHSCVETASDYYNRDMAVALTDFNSGVITGPISIGYTDLLRTDITNGVKVCPLYAQGGQSTAYAVSKLKDTNVKALAFWLKAMTYGTTARPVFQNLHLGNDEGDTSNSWNPATQDFDATAIGRTSEGHANNVQGILYYLRAGMVEAGLDPDSLIFIDGPYPSHSTTDTGRNWDGTTMDFNEIIPLAAAAVGALGNSQIAVIDGSIWVPYAASPTGDELGPSDGQDSKLLHLVQAGYEKWGRRVIAAMQAATPASNRLNPSINTLINPPINPGVN